MHIADQKLVEITKSLKLTFFRKVKNLRVSSKPMLTGVFWNDIVHPSNITRYKIVGILNKLQKMRIVLIFAKIIM